jgi:hypothetical protein
MGRERLALGTAPGIAAGMAPIHGFRWPEIIEVVARRSVTTSTEKVESDGFGTEP